MSQTVITLRSSQIANVVFKRYGENPLEDTGILYVQFHSHGDEEGPWYSYDDVPCTLYVDMLHNESQGKFFSTHIKSRPDAYSYKKVEHPEDLDFHV